MDKKSLANYFLGEEYEPKKQTLPRNRPPTRRSLALTKLNATKQTYSNTLRSGKRLRNNTMKNKSKKPNLSLVKVIKNTSVSKTNIEKVLQFQNEIKNIPVYFINGHSCICELEGLCHGDKINPLFKIPDNTYLLTFGTSTDFSCLSEYDMALFNAYVPHLRRFLLVHSASDVELSKNIGKTLFSFFADLKRATQGKVDKSIVFPNLNYSFNNKINDEYTPPNKNPYGVYRIDVPELPSAGDINNTISIIPQDSNRKNWFLSDIISEVYKKTRIHKGIFINGGCLSSCSKNATGPHMDKVGQIMTYNHNMYPTLRETLTKDEATKLGVHIPYNFGLRKPFTYENPSELKEFINAGLFKANAVVDMDLLYHEENKPVLEAMK